MAKPAKAGQNLTPEWTKKVQDDAVKAIEKEREHIDSALGTFRNKKKIHGGRIATIKKNAKEDGADIDAIEELLKTRKAARAQTKRRKKLTKDTLKHVAASDLKPKPSQLDMFKDPTPAAEPEPKANDGESGDEDTANTGGRPNNVMKLRD